MCGILGAGSGQAWACCSAYTVPTDAHLSAGGSVLLLPPRWGSFLTLWGWGLVGRFWGPQLASTRV